MKNKLTRDITCFICGVLSTLLSIAGIIVCFIIGKNDTAHNAVIVAILLHICIGLLFAGVYIIICVFVKGDDNDRNR